MLSKTATAFAVASASIFALLSVPTTAGASTPSPPSSSAGVKADQATIENQQFADVAALLERSIPQHFVGTGRSDGQRVLLVQADGVQAAKDLVNGKYKVKTSLALSAQQEKEYRVDLAKRILELNGVKQVGVVIDRESAVPTVTLRHEKPGTAGVQSATEPGTAEQATTDSPVQSAEEKVQEVAADWANRLGNQNPSFGGGISPLESLIRDGAKKMKIDAQKADFLELHDWGGPGDMHTKRSQRHYCTAAFTLKSGPAWGFASAGHCDSDPSEVGKTRHTRWKPWLQKSDSKDYWVEAELAANTYSTHVGKEKGWWGDAAAYFVRPGGGIPTARHGTGWFSSMETHRAFDSYSNPKDGHIVCHFGQTTGGPSDQQQNRGRHDLSNKKCGRVVAQQTVVWKEYGHVDRHQYLILNTNTGKDLGVEGGDSGGPVFWNHNAHGVIVGSSTHNGKRHTVANPISTFAGLGWPVVCKHPGKHDHCVKP